MTNIIKHRNLSHMSKPLILHIWFAVFYISLTIYPLTVEEIPKLTRTLTTVSTDYQFSTCYVQQLGNVFSYDYEYLGPCSHLVVTPLTERAFLALGHALKTFHCATLIGPNGTGKTETIKELGKVIQWLEMKYQFNTFAFDIVSD